MGLASSLKKVASKSLVKLGGSVTIRQVTNGSYDTATGAVSESNSDTVVKGLLENINNTEVNDLIQAEDKKLTISAGDITFVPTPKDKVVVASVIFKIITVVTNQQNNIPITFELFLRS